MGCRRLTGPAGADREGLRGALVMAEAFTVRGLDVTQIQRGHEVLSTLDPELGRLIRDELTGHGVDVVLDTTVEQIEKTPEGLAVTGRQNGQPIARTADLVLVVVGVRPNTELLESAGATLGAGGAVVVDTSPARQTHEDLALMECRYWWGRAYRQGRLSCARVGVTVVGDVRLGVDPIRHCRVLVQFLEPIDATLRGELQRLVAVRGARSKRFAEALASIEIARSDQAGSHRVRGRLEPPVTHRHAPQDVSLCAASRRSGVAA